MAEKKKKTRFERIRYTEGMEPEQKDQLLDKVKIETNLKEKKK